MAERMKPLHGHDFFLPNAKLDTTGAIPLEFSATKNGINAMGPANTSSYSENYGSQRTTNFRTASKNFNIYKTQIFLD